MFSKNPTQHITEYHSLYFQEWWWLHHVMSMSVISKDKGGFLGIKINRKERSTGKILEENLVVCFTIDIGRPIYLSAEQQPKHKAKYTLELLTKTTLNVPEWPSYNFDLNQLE